MGMPDEVTADIRTLVDSATRNDLEQPTVGVAMQVMHALSLRKPDWIFSHGLLYGLAVRRYLEKQAEDEFQIPTELPKDA